MENNEDKPTPPVVSDISARLSEQGSVNTEHTDDPKAAEPQAFDLSKLSHEQLQQLKAMLNSTPDRVMLKQSNPIIQLRRYDGKFVIDFKDTFLTMVRDEQANLNKEVIMMPVKFLGEDVFVNVPWRDFMNAEQVKCEVLSTRRVQDRIVEGQVVSKETGRLVEREIRTVQDFFTVQLPEGMTPATIEIEGKIANQ